MSRTRVALESAHEAVAELVVDAIRTGAASRVGLVARTHRTAGMTLLPSIMNVAPSYFQNPIGQVLEFHNGARVNTHAVDDLDGATLDFAWCGEVDDWSEKRWVLLLASVPAGRIVTLVRDPARLLEFTVTEAEWSRGRTHFAMSPIAGLHLTQVTVTRPARPA